LVADDVMDGSIQRRGQPCWYRNPDVGMIAINDGIIIEAAMYQVRRRRRRRRRSWTWKEGRRKTFMGCDETMP
jgi:farnesyl diphosphate synthase